MNHNRVWDIKAEVMAVTCEKGGMYRALLRAPEIAREAVPLQFVNVRVAPGIYPLLRRPFSLSGIYPEEGMIEITWAVVGLGTSIMTGWSAGTTVQVMGPLGNGYVPPRAGDAEGSSAVMMLVAGGTGLAPMYPLAHAASKNGWDVKLFYGARSSSNLMDVSRFEKLGCKVRVCTEDGSEGTRGLVTSIIEEDLRSAGETDVVVACGPRPMLRKLKTMGKSCAAQLLVVLEERMACGTGLCRGCVVRTSKHDGYLHVCTDGPVFRADEVDLGQEEG